MASPLRTREVPSIDGRDPFTIGFYDKPYHSYRLGAHGAVLDATAPRVVSVTGVTGLPDKSGPLKAWAAKIDVEAARRMATEDWVRCVFAAYGLSNVEPCKQALVPIPAHDAPDACAECGRGLYPYRLPDAGWKLQRDIRLAGLDHNTITTGAQLRGTAVHKLHEDWVNDGKVPVLSEWREAWRGYVQSYARFLMWATGRGVTFEVAEVLVGSKRHGFAGTCDTVAVATADDGRRARLDFKTSAEVRRTSHFPQLAGYELGAVECGDEPTDRQGIVLLREDGTFDPKRDIHYATTTAEDFLVLLAAFKSQKPLRDADDKAYRARKKAGK